MRVDVKQVAPAFGGRTFGTIGAYERVDAIVHFRVDPDHPLNAGIVNVRRAPRESDGRVAFDADVVVYRPAALAKSSGLMVYEPVNRGASLLLGLFNDAAAWASNRGQGQGTGGASETRESLPQSKDRQLIDAIDWAIEENARRDSPYYQRLATDRIAVMGQSCGGLQTIAVSGDPRIKTSVIWNSGVFPNDAHSIAMRISDARKEHLAKLHAPVAYFIGGPTDAAYPNAEDDFKRITTVPVFKGNLNVGHGGTFRHPGAGWFGEVGVAWLDWQLKGDEKAAKYFVGADCVLCTNPIWKVAKKGIE